MCNTQGSDDMHVVLVGQTADAAVSLSTEPLALWNAKLTMASAIPRLGSSENTLHVCR